MKRVLNVSSNLLSGLGLATILLAAVVFTATPQVSFAAEGGGCSGSCNFSNGMCRSVDCDGSGCSCSGGRSDCGCS